MYKKNRFVLHVLTGCMEFENSAANIKSRPKNTRMKNRCYTWLSYNSDKMLSHRRETALQGALVLAKSERLELGDNRLMHPAARSLR